MVPELAMPDAQDRQALFVFFRQVSVVYCNLGQFAFLADCTVTLSASFSGHAMLAP